MTKNGRQFLGKNRVTLSVITTGDTNLSDATADEWFESSTWMTS